MGNIEKVSYEGQLKTKIRGLGVDKKSLLNGQDGCFKTFRWPWFCLYAQDKTRADRQKLYGGFRRASHNPELFGNRISSLGKLWFLNTGKKEKKMRVHI